MDKEQVLEHLTEEQRKEIEKLDALLSDPENQKKISAMTSVDEVFSFYEEHGYEFTEDQKKMIREKSEELAARSKEGELTEEELEAVAGGWGWSNFFKGSGWGAIVGGAIGYGFATVIVVGTPVGWAVGIGALVAGGTLGVLNALD